MEDVMIAEKKAASRGGKEYLDFQMPFPSIMSLEVKNRLNEASHENIHRGILKGVRNTAETLQYNELMFFFV